MSTLREDYRIVTGLVTDIDKILAADITDDAKKAMFRKLVWHMPAGCKFAAGTELGDKISEVLNTAISKLGIDAKEALEDDGFLSKRDMSILSTIEVETEDPTEEPTETPTEKPDEPVEDPTEEPNENPTEEPEEVEDMVDESEE